MERQGSIRIERDDVGWVRADGLDCMDLFWEKRPMTYSLTFELDGLPKSQINNYASKWARAKSKKEWEMRVHVATLGKRPPKPLMKARLRFVRCSASPPDYTNLVASFKDIEDGLVKCGIIFDDAMEYVGKPDYDWEKAKPKAGKVRVRVEEGEGIGE